MNSRREKKAQSLVLEQVLLFAIGIAVFIACVGIFIIYQNSFVAMSSDDQLKQVKDFVVSNILKLSNRENETNTSMILIYQKE